MLTLLLISLAQAATPIPASAGQERTCAQDARGAADQLSVDLGMISRQLAEEQDLDVRSRLFLEKNRVRFAGLACQCTLSEGFAPCAEALGIRSDRDLLEFEQQPTRRIRCLTGTGPERLADCVRANLGSGALVETYAAGGGVRFTSFVSEREATRVVSGSFEEGSLQIAAGTRDPDPWLSRRLSGSCSLRDSRSHASTGSYRSALGSGAGSSDSMEGSFSAPIALGRPTL